MFDQIRHDFKKSISFCLTIGVIKIVIFIIKYFSFNYSNIKIKLNKKYRYLFIGLACLKYEYFFQNNKQNKL